MRHHLGETECLQCGFLMTSEDPMTICFSYDDNSMPAHCLCTPASQNAAGVASTASMLLRKGIRSKLDTDTTETALNIQLYELKLETRRSHWGSKNHSCDYKKPLAVKMSENLLRAGYMGG